jgi:hypothetical protein
LPCPVGTYGDVEGLTDATCSGPCTPSPGYNCDLGSVDVHGQPCVAGKYSTNGLTVRDGLVAKL